MTRSELVDRLARRCDLPRTVADSAVRLLFQRMREQLMAGGRIEIRGFGSFQIRQYPGHEARHPRDPAKVIKVSPKVLPVFRAGLELKRRVDEGTSTKEPSR